jgi:hypothetical protein
MSGLPFNLAKPVGKVLDRLWVTCGKDNAKIPVFVPKRRWVTCSLFVPSGQAENRARMKNFHHLRVAFFRRLG